MFIRVIVLKNLSDNSPLVSGLLLGEGECKLFVYLT